MKTKLISTVVMTAASAALIMVLTPGLASAGTIVGSDHDFSNNGWAGGEICVACHTPHNADLTVLDAPLWNHEVSTATYQVYTSNSLDATVGQPDGVSKLCLSCHDGTVAVDSFGGTTGSTFIGGSKDLTTDLRDDHPISMVYDAALASADGGLWDPTSQTVTIGDPGDKQKSGTLDAVMLSGTKVECSSCHDVHNTFAVNNTKLLKVTNAASALCLSCHDK